MIKVSQLTVQPLYLRAKSMSMENELWTTISGTVCCQGKVHRPLSTHSFTMKEIFPFCPRKEISVVKRRPKTAGKDPMGTACLDMQADTASLDMQADTACLDTQADTASVDIWGTQPV